MLAPLRFLGCGKTGHTLVAAMLDSCPHVAIDNSYSEDEDMEGWIDRSKDPMNWARGAKYKFPIVGQGTHDKLRVVGTTRLVEDPPYFFPNTHTLAVIRNPFHTVASLEEKHKNRSKNPFGTALWMLRKAVMAWEHANHTVYLEALVRQPKLVLQGLCLWLDLPDEHWIDRAKYLVTQSSKPSFSHWSDDQLSQVQRLVKHSILLKRYGN